MGGSLWLGARLYPQDQPQRAATRKSAGLTAVLRLVFDTAALLVLAGAVLPGSARGETLQELAARQPLKLFTATKGAVMPNSTDQVNNLAEGDKALLLSERGLTDITGISTLTVEDGGKPVPIGSVKRLHLFFNQNRIAVMPEEIGVLTNVIFVYFERNRMHELPRAMTGMKSLEGVYFTANEFTEIPAFLFEMTQLRKLQFSRNQISVLPPEIGRLQQLIHLNLSHNRIAVVPDTIANLNRLRVCDLSDNRIATLPEAFGGVQILYQLRVRDNPLTNLPAGFAALRATIDITGTKIDPATLPPGVRARINTRKAPGLKSPDSIIVTAPKKNAADGE